MKFPRATRQISLSSAFPPPCLPWSGANGARDSYRGVMDRSSMACWPGTLHV